MPTHYLPRTTIQGTGSVDCSRRSDSDNPCHCYPSPDRPIIEHPWCPVFDHARTTSIRSEPIRVPKPGRINSDHVNTRWHSHQTRSGSPNEATCLPWPASLDQPRPSQKLLKPCLPASRGRLPSHPSRTTSSIKDQYLSRSTLYIMSLQPYVRHIQLGPPIHPSVRNLELLSGAPSRTLRSRSWLNQFILQYTVSLSHAFPTTKSFHGR